MELDTIWKLTGYLSLSYGVYCIMMAAMVMIYEPVEFFVIFALIILAFGMLYIIAGISMLRHGRLGFFAFFGMFGSTFWWTGGIPYYLWPMIVMPLVIAVLFVLLFIQSNIAGLR